jgi:hypothetical protein
MSNLENQVIQDKVEITQTDKTKPQFTFIAFQGKSLIDFVNSPAKWTEWTKIFGKEHLESWKELCVKYPDKYKIRALYESDDLSGVNHTTPIESDTSPYKEVYIKLQFAVSNVIKDLSASKSGFKISMRNFEKEVYAITQRLEFLLKEKSTIESITKSTGFNNGTLFSDSSENNVFKASPTSIPIKPATSSSFNAIVKNKLKSNNASYEFDTSGRYS